MPRWFLSYNSSDHVLAERVKFAVERKDPGSSVFYAPASLRAGGFWSAQLAQEIAEASAFILLVGERGLGSWQVFEYDEALDKRVKHADFPVILVLLEGQTAPGLQFLRRLHWIISPDPTSEKDTARLFDAATGDATRAGELWRHTSPYRGLAAMEEKDSDYFFGRGRETVEVLKAIAETPDRLPMLLGNSGVGKSSLAQAGVLAALKRQAWPEGVGAPAEWPHVFKDSRRWCFLTLRANAEPIRALVEAFLETWQLDRTSTEWPERRAEWVNKLIGGQLNLGDLLDQTKRRYVQLQHPEPAAFFIYIDQGEELYVRAEASQRARFSRLIADALADPRLYALMSLRADFFGELQKDEPLYKAHRIISVPPLREAELREVVSRPAALLSARFETDRLADTIAQRTAEESAKDAGALPLLSYLLDDMWTQMVERGDGVLRLPEQAFELGGVLVGRANAFIAAHPNSEGKLRRIFTLKLATVREDGEPTRRRAWRSEFSDEEWRIVTELADHPNRLLVTGRPEANTAPAVAQAAHPDSTATAKEGETYTEVAHEAIFRRWGKLREWIAAEREFLAWRSGLEAARRAWQATPDNLKIGALLMGLALEQAKNWHSKRFDDLPQADRKYIELSRKEEQRRTLRMRAQVGMLAVVMVAGLVGWMNEAHLRETWRWFTSIRPYMQSQVRPHVLTAAAERALNPKDTFRECAKDCPMMIVIPAGDFIMGSKLYLSELPQHQVTIAKPFAVGKFEVTFDDWDACAAYGDCDSRVNDSGWGHGQRPVMNVTWDDAQRYAAWLSRMTGKRYRLLTESEWEYVARAGSATTYPWGEEIGKGNANCNGCGSEWDAKHTAPVGSMAANAFGVHEMQGNVWEWVEDCNHPDYKGAPTDGSAWIADGACHVRIARGGSWNVSPQYLRSAYRYQNLDAAGNRNNLLGFRVARTLEQ